jgi:hypothetical protein
MNVKWLFLGIALSLSLPAGSAFADEGVYQQANDGKTMVWNNHPLTGESAEWSGDRDKDGYATGSGTITWYKQAQSGYTFAKKNQSVVSARYSGTMVKGKFEGVVVKLGKVPTFAWQPTPASSHATFVGGKQTSEWVPGPAPGSGPEKGDLPAKKKKN